MDALTPGQDRILRFVAGFSRERGFPPSVREIGRACGGIKSSTVAYHIKALTRKGVLSRGSSRARDLRLAEAPATYGLAGVGMRGHPLLGRVPAGRPNLAEDGVEDTIWLDEKLSRSKDSYLLKVKGDSMTGAGIVEGDMIVVRPQPSAESGEIVVAVTPEGEGTVKTFRSSAKGVRLEPANPRYEPIPMPFRIVGKVVGLVRRMP
jgi:repressor LexA